MYCKIISQIIKHSLSLQKFAMNYNQKLKDLLEKYVSEKKTRDALEKLILVYTKEIEKEIVQSKINEVKELILNRFEEFLSNNSQYLHQKYER